MKSTIGAIALIGGVMASAAAVALAGSTAFAETAADEQRARLAILWGQDKAATTNRTADTRANFTGVGSGLSFGITNQWAGNYRAGRVEPPAGR